MTKTYVTARVLATLAALLVLSGLASPVQAQPWVPGKGHGSVSLTYDQKVSTELTFADGTRLVFGSLIDRGMTLHADYGLSDRWAISATLPYGRNRYTGDDPHDPTQFPFPAGQTFIDDGLYHGGWSDATLALRYQWRTSPLLVTPFVSYSWPVRDYTIYGHASVGNNQWNWQAGVHVGQWLPPPWQTWYWRAGYAYQFNQRLDNRRVNRGLLSLAVGWVPNNRINFHLSLEHENSFGDTVDLPQDFAYPDGSPNVGVIIYHDQIAAARSTKASFGVSYSLGDHWTLSAEGGRTLAAANVHVWRYETSIGLTRSF
jgi:hypothetical protein